MSLTIEITKEPSTQGSTQTRVVEAAVSGLSTESNVKVQFRLDGSGNGTFTFIGQKTVILGTNETKTVSFEEFIGVQTPYTIQLTAVATIGGEDVTAVAEADIFDTGPVGSFEDDPDGDETLDNTGTAPTGTATGNIRPRIGPVEPLIMRCEYDLPWNVESTQTACGRTIQNQNGDKNWEITIEGKLTLNQLRRLKNLRNSAESVTIRTAEFGTIDVVFDTLSLSRVDGEDVGELEGVDGPIIGFQLQSTETGENDSTTFGEEAITAQSAGDS